MTKQDAAAVLQDRCLRLRTKLMTVADSINMQSSNEQYEALVSGMIEHEAMQLAIRALHPEAGNMD